MDVPRPEQKPCSNCGVIKDEWNKNKGRSAGGQWRCSSCRRRDSSEWRQANPEKVRRRNAHRLRAGHSYIGMAKSIEDANRINTHLAMRLAEFKADQAQDREDFRG